MQNKDPLIVIVCEDLFFLPRIQDAAIALGYRYEAIAKKEDIGVFDPMVRREIPLTEPLEGPESALIRYLVDQHPALIIIDTAHQSIPWRTWIQVIKTSSATRRIPIIAFGSHVLEEPLTDATEAGADQTISRGRLQASLAELITKWSMIPDHDAIALACGESLSEDTEQGVELIAKGHYYDAHEILEMVWQNARGAENYLLRTLLQVSVTYLHIERGNFRGAMKMLLRVKHWLAPLPSECQGINVEALGGTLAKLRVALEESNLEGTQASFTQFLVPIPLVEGKS